MSDARVFREPHEKLGREVCSACRRPLVWANGRLVCPYGSCPGHEASEKPE